MWQAWAKWQVSMTWAFPAASFLGRFRQYAKPWKLDVRLHALVDSDDANDVSKEGVWIHSPKAAVFFFYAERLYFTIETPILMAE